jgi:hypothetical protein
LGATSKFVPEDMNLPKKELSNKEVYLPDNSKLKASYTMELPFKQLSKKAREADILPGLNPPLISVNKMVEEGYTTVFHLGEKGVMIHKPGSISITTTEPSILQGCKSKGAKLWTISDNEKSMKERASNVYDVPSISQAVKYLQVVAGFPTEETWLKAIKARNFPMWPMIITSNVRHHFPESDETKKGHMKNFIDAEPMKNKSEGAMIKAYTTLWTQLTDLGTVKPKTHILDNKASAEFKKEIQKNCTTQLVPPNNHRRNSWNVQYKPLRAISKPS